MVVFLVLAPLGPSFAATLDGTMHVADMTAPPPTLDPFKVYGTQTQSLYRQIFDNLIDRDAEGQLIPGIAEAWKYLGKNLWEIRMRRDVVFHDGSPLTSRDVKFSLERLIDPASVQSRRRDFSFIQRVESVNPAVVRIQTAGPSPTLPARLAQFSLILPAERIRRQGEEAFFKAPVGVGPFRFVKMNSEMAVLERHDRYYRGRPEVKGLVFHFFKDPRHRYRALVEGQLNILTNVQPSFARDVAANPGLAVVKKHALQFSYVVLDTLSPGPLQDRRVRQALAHWTDVASLIRFVANGNGRPVATFVMPEDYGFDPSLKPYPFDSGRAKELMRQAGHSEGFSLAALTSDEMEPVARAVVKQWARLGVKVNLEVASRSQAIRFWTRTRNFRAFFFSPTDPVQDAGFHLRIKLDPRHPINRFHHPATRELVQKMDEIENGPERLEVLHRLQGIAHAELPAITFYQQVKIYAIARRVKGFTGYPDTILRLHSLSMGQELSLGGGTANEEYGP